MPAQSMMNAEQKKLAYAIATRMLELDEQVAELEAKRIAMLATAKMNGVSLSFIGIAMERSRGYMYKYFAPVEQELKRRAKDYPQ